MTSEPKRVLMLTYDQMIDRRILQQAEILSQNGYIVSLLAGFECVENDFYSSANLTVRRFCYDWSDTRIEKLCRVLRLRASTRLSNLVWRVARKILATVSLSSIEQFVFEKASKEEFEIVHAHDLPMLRVAPLAKKKQAKLVFDAHEIYYEQSSLSSLVRAKLKLTERILSPRADLMITVNPLIADYFKKVNNLKRVEVITNATVVKPIVGKGDLRKDLTFTGRQAGNLPRMDLS